MKTFIFKVFIFSIALFPASVSAEAEPSQGPSPEKSPDRFEEEEVPLDVWIVPKKKEPLSSLTPGSSPSPSSSPLSEAERIAEEKKIYKELLEKYKKESQEKTLRKKQIVEKENARIFRKTALSKKDLARIDKVKAIQKKIVAEQKREFSELLEKKVEEDSTFRLCMLNHPAIGLPSELRKVDATVMSAKITEDWRSGLKLILQENCSLVIYTGIFGKTTTKSQEFLVKTLEYLGKQGQPDWKMILNSKDANSVFAVLYNSSVIEVLKSESLDRLSLRRGGLFQEDKFSLVPLELLIEKKNETSPRRYNIISFDIRDKTYPQKKPKIYHQMQMASALLEASLQRVNKKKDESIIMAGFLGESRTHPSFQMLQGIMTPVDFLEGKACKLNDIKDNDSELFSCDKTQLPKSHRVMMGIFSELPTLFDKKERQSIDRNINKLTSEIFIEQSSIENIKSSNKNNKLLGASFDVIKGKQFEYSFLYVDLLAGKKE